MGPVGPWTLARPPPRGVTLSVNFIVKQLTPAHLTQLWARVTSRLQRWRFLLPIASMAWGIASAIMVSREYEKSGPIVGYLAALLVLSSLLGEWLDLRHRAQSRPLPPPSPPGVKSRIWDWAQKRPRIVEEPALQVTQYCAQYIVTFSIPLLWIQKAWALLGLALGLAATTLWDAWWRALIIKAWYRTLLRVSSTVFAVAFAFAVFFPDHLEWYRWSVGLAGVLSAIPWRWAQRARDRSPLDLAPAGVLLAVLLGTEPRLGSSFKIPMLSVWTEAPALGQGLTRHQLQEPFASPIRRDQLRQALASDGGLCCLTPIRGPAGINAPLTHEWYVDGQLIESISLPRIKGQGSKHGAYRTHSCKHSLPRMQTIREVRCIAALGGDQWIGEATLGITENPQ